MTDRATPRSDGMVRWRGNLAAIVLSMSALSFVIKWFVSGFREYNGTSV